MNFIYWLHNLFENKRFGGASRSPEWPEVRNAFLKENPRCAVCGTKGGLLKPLNVHHIQVFHLNPLLELDKTNLIILCRKDHFLFGHLNNWSSFNKDVVSDSSLWKEKILTRPE